MYLSVERLERVEEYTDTRETIIISWRLSIYCVHRKDWGSNGFDHVSAKSAFSLVYSKVHWYMKSLFMLFCVCEYIQDP